MTVLRSDAFGAMLGKQKLLKGLTAGQWSVASLFLIIPYIYAF